MRFLLIIYFFLYISSYQTSAKMVNLEDSTDRCNINIERFAFITGSTLGTASAIHIYQYNSWWKDKRRPFHFQEDLIYGKSVDKIGHFWGAAFSSFVLKSAYEWSGFKKETSVWIGAIAGSIFQLFVEFQDGFSDWGFDRVDAATDIAGGFFPMLQYYVPYLDKVNIKASYYPRKLGKSGNIPGQKHTLLDDYEGQTFWLTFDVSQYLENLFEPLKYLGIAIGYSVRNLSDTNNQYAILLFSIDYNFKNIIPQKSEFLKVLSEGLNYFKFPSPAIQIAPKTIFFGFYF